MLEKLIDYFTGWFNTLYEIFHVLVDIAAVCFVGTRLIEFLKGDKTE